MKMRRFALLLVFVLGLAACSKEEPAALPGIITIDGLEIVLGSTTLDDLTSAGYVEASRGYSNSYDAYGIVTDIVLQKEDTLIIVSCIESHTDKGKGRIAGVMLQGGTRPDDCIYNGMPIDEIDLDMMEQWNAYPMEYRRSQDSGFDFFFFRSDETDSFRISLRALAPRVDTVLQLVDLAPEATPIQKEPAEKPFPLWPKWSYEEDWKTQSAIIVSYDGKEAQIDAPEPLHNTGPDLEVLEDQGAVYYSHFIRNQIIYGKVYLDTGSISPTVGFAYNISTGEMKHLGDRQGIMTLANGKSIALTGEEAEREYVLYGDDMTPAAQQLDLSFIPVITYEDRRSQWIQGFGYHYTGYYVVEYSKRIGSEALEEEYTMDLEDEFVLGLGILDETSGQLVYTLELPEIWD